MDFIFWLRQKRNSTQKTIIARITINGIRKNFSTSIDIEPKYWQGNDLLISNHSNLFITYNEILLYIKADVYKAFVLIKKQRTPITTDTIYKKYIWLNNESRSIPQKHVPSLHDILSLGMKRKREEIGFSLTESSYKCYRRYERNFLRFLKYKRLNEYEMLITDLTLDLGNEFIRDLGMRQSLSKAYANKHRELLRIIVNTAHYEAEEWKLKLRTRDLKSFTEPKPDITALTPIEVTLIEKYPFSGKLEYARDMLLMLCETGQHVGDYAQIVKQGSILLDSSGDLWVKLERQKTKITLNIFLTKRAITLIKKYGGLNKLPIVTGQRANDYLKLVANYTYRDSQEALYKNWQKNLCSILP